MPTNVSIQNHLVFRVVSFPRRLYVAQTFRSDARGTQIRQTKQLTYEQNFSSLPGHNNGCRCYGLSSVGTDSRVEDLQQ